MRSFHLRVALLIVVFPIYELLAWSHSIRAEHQRLFASGDGLWGFKIVPEDRKFKGILFSVNPDGTDTLVWKQDLSNYPLDVRIYGDERQTFVVTMDEDAGGSDRYIHALTIYGRAGKLIRDFRLEELLSKDDISQHLQGAFWAKEAQFSYVRDAKTPRLRISFKWGKVVTLGLQSGDVVPSELTGTIKNAGRAGSVNVDVKDADFRNAIDLLFKLAPDTEVKKLIMPAHYNPITIALEDQQWEAALHYVCKQAGARLKRQGHLYVIYPLWFEAMTRSMSGHDLDVFVRAARDKD